MLIAAADAGGSSSNVLAIAALAVAGLSLVVAAAALGWQIAAWLLEAGRARVQLRFGAISMTGGGLVTHPVDGDLQPSKVIADLVSQGYNQPVIAVSIRNTGRAPVWIHSLTAHAEALGISFMPIADLIGERLPARLEAGEANRWAFPLDRAISVVRAGQAIKNTGGVDSVYVEVELGSGKKLRTPTSLLVAA